MAANPPWWVGVPQTRALPAELGQCSGLASHWLGGILKRSRSSPFLPAACLLPAWERKERQGQGPVAPPRSPLQPTSTPWLHPDRAPAPAVPRGWGSAGHCPRGCTGGSASSMVSLGALGRRDPCADPTACPCHPLCIQQMPEQHQALGRVQEMVSACTSGWWHGTSLPACAGGLETPMAAWHGEWEGPGTGSLPGDGMWLVLAADAVGQRNEGEGQASSGDSDVASGSLGMPTEPVLSCRGPLPCKDIACGLQWGHVLSAPLVLAAGMLQAGEPRQPGVTMGSPCPVLGAGRAGPSSPPSPLGRALAWGGQEAP